MVRNGCEATSSLGRIPLLVFANSFRVGRGLLCVSFVLWREKRGYSVGSGGKVWCWLLLPDSLDFVERIDCECFRVLGWDAMMAAGFGFIWLCVSC